MQKLADRLSGTREALGLSQQKLADKAGVALRTIQNWENPASKEPQPAKLSKVAQALNVSIDYLLGKTEGKWDQTLSDEPTKYRLGNASDVMMLTELAPHKVPVVSWAKAGAGISYHDLAEQIDEYVLSDAPDPNAYALIIEGDSMEPEYKSGDRVIFLPNQEARNGDVVVARVAESGEVYFKLFHTFGPRNEKVRLTSYNTIYPTLEFDRKDFRFIHPMHSMWRKRRR